MDYDHPYRGRSSQLKGYLTAVIMLAAAGVLWGFVDLVDVVWVRLRASPSPGIVVGYEVAGGKRRLRVQMEKDGRPAGFVLLDPMAAWPEYAPGQRVQVLTWRVTNQFGRPMNQTAAYSPWNYWPRPLLKILGAAAVAGIAAAGLAGIARREGRETRHRPPPLPGADLLPKHPL